MSCDTNAVPINVDAERSVVGAMLMTASMPPDSIMWDMSELRAIVTAAAFTDPDCKTVFAAILKSVDEGEPVDSISLIPRLNAGPDSECGDWMRSCLVLMESVPSSANALFYAKEVRKAWQLRSIAHQCGLTEREACNQKADPSEIIAKLSKSLDSINEASATDQEAICEGEMISEMENPAGRTFGVKVPVTMGELGYLLGGGLDGGTLTIIGARPSCGKTSLGLGLCVHASRATEGCPSLFISLEMGVRQVALRLLSMRSGIAVQRIRSGCVGDDEFVLARNKAANEAYGGQPVLVLDRVRDARAISAFARRCVRRDGVRLIVIDYLGLCTMPGIYDRHDLRVGATTGLFKTLASDTDTAVVVLAQLNRGSDKDVRRPRMSDLRDSGIIEADADNVILIHREREPSGEACETTLILDKQRQGQTGNVLVQYHRPTMQYRAKQFAVEIDTPFENQVIM